MKSVCCWICGKTGQSEVSLLLGAWTDVCKMCGAYLGVVETEVSSLDQFETLLLNLLLNPRAQTIKSFGASSDLMPRRLKPSGLSHIVRQLRVNYRCWSFWRKGTLSLSRILLHLPPLPAFSSAQPEELSDLFPICTKRHSCSSEPQLFL